MDLFDWLPLLQSTTHVREVAPQDIVHIGLSHGPTMTVSLFDQWLPLFPSSMHVREVTRKTLVHYDSFPNMTSSQIIWTSSPISKHSASPSMIHAHPNISPHNKH
ncbi:hypothetical protein HGRIS_008210 [Hohenbuehelia grisea]|uniref:Uncharacterized protein n=1 Tax=Hohenbuehelia grisea TaxID=104357 RepID=A0ABR3J7A0_9AGAR